MKRTSAQKLIQIASGLGFVKRKVARKLGGGLLLAALAAFSPTAAVADEAPFDYSTYARVLENYVTPEGKVRYAALKKHPEDLDAFLAEVAAVSPVNHPERFPTDDHKIAYWINAYNAFVLKSVLEDYPIESVIRLGTLWGVLFFKRSKHEAGGKEYSLDDIEHGILRRQFQEPRIHFAINCASASCPVLRAEPYRAEHLDAQLDAQARDFIRQQQNVWLRGNILFLSKIFDWYEQDFLKALERDGSKNPTLADYVARYLPAETAARLREESPRIEFYDYDWALNDASGGGGSR
ncbi:MAG: DUF547 domain-containing protein [Terriglobia bacterium]